MYRRGQMLVIGNALDRALNTSLPGKPTYRERLAAARDDLETNNLSVKALARAAAAMWQTGRENYTAMETIKTDRDLVPTAREQRLGAKREEYNNTQLVADVGRLQAALDGVRALVLPTAPEFPPRDATDATRINGICSDADSYDPTVFYEVLRAAITRKDFPLVARLRAKLAGFREWKKPFADDPGGDVLEEAEAMLGTDDVIRSAVAKEFIERAETDIRYFVVQLSNGDGKIDPIHFITGAVLTLFPDLAPPGQRPLSPSDSASLT
jgi:hypothetical protein